jgi:hypothetical protein
MWFLDRFRRSGPLFRTFSPILAGAVMCLSACGGQEDVSPVPVFSEGKPPLQEPPPHQVGGFSAQLPMETLAPGEERQICYVLPMDIQGPSRVVGGGVLTTGPGLHHGNVTSQKKGDGIPPRPPDGGSAARPATSWTEGPCRSHRPRRSRARNGRASRGNGVPIRDG